LAWILGHSRIFGYKRPHSSNICYKQFPELNYQHLSLALGFGLLKLIEQSITSLSLQANSTLAKLLSLDLIHQVNCICSRIALRGKSKFVVSLKSNEPDKLQKQVLISCEKLTFFTEIVHNYPYVCWPTQLHTFSHCQISKMDQAWSSPAEYICTVGQYCFHKRSAASAAFDLLEGAQVAPLRSKNSN
jgi:hypothetical protein